MGDRISIQFVNGNQKSVVLFSHWDGQNILLTIKAYLDTLLPVVAEAPRTPASRLEPQTIMVDFVRYLTQDEQHITSNYYFGFNESDGDNSDNGHYEIDLPLFIAEAQKKTQALKNQLEDALLDVLNQGQYNQIKDYKESILKTIITRL